MTTLTFTKSQIIEALRTEPNLWAGMWIDGPEDETLSTDTQCQVCAVGALLRSPDRTVDAVEHLASDLTAGCAVAEESPKWLLRQGRFLNALSCAFENSGGDREETITFVEENFPDVISQGIVWDARYGGAP